MIMEWPCPSFRWAVRPSIYIRESKRERERGYKKLRDQKTVDSLKDIDTSNKLFNI